MARENKRKRAAREVRREIANQLNELAQNATNNPDAQVTTTTIRTFEETLHSGPLPAPDTLAEYDRIMPGLAKQIVDEAGKESAYRRDFSRRALDATIEDGKAARRIEGQGQLFAFILSLVIIVGGVLLIFNGHEKSGVTFVTGTVLGLAGLFIYGRMQKPKSGKEKPKEGAEQESTDLATTANK